MTFLIKLWWGGIHPWLLTRAGVVRRLWLQRDKREFSGALHSFESWLSQWLQGSLCVLKFIQLYTKKGSKFYNDNEKKNIYGKNCSLWISAYFIPRMAATWCSPTAGSAFQEWGLKISRLGVKKWPPVKVDLNSEMSFPLKDLWKG